MQINQITRVINNNEILRLYRYIEFLITQKYSDYTVRVSIRKTFAQFLRNETQNFSFFAHQFCAKKQQFAQSFAKSHFAQNCPIPLLRNSSFAQFRNFVPKSETDCPVKVLTILVLDMHIS